MSINLRITGIAEAALIVRGFPKDIQRHAILRLSQVAYENAYSGAAKHSKTGVLLQSLFNRATANGRIIGHDTERAPQALFVNAGTKPHDIRPRNKKALRWVSGSKFAFAKFVRHPGYRGDPYIIRAADAAIRQFSAIIDAAAKDSK